MKRLTGRLAAALLAALVIAPAAAATDDHGRKKHDELEISVVSSPAQYVSGGDARIEIAVPDRTPLDDVDVTLNGADVTSASRRIRRATTSSRASSPACRSARARIVASSHKRGKGQQAPRRARARQQPAPGRRSSPGRARCRSSARRRATPPAWRCRRSRSRRPARRRRVVVVRLPLARPARLAAVRPGRAAARRAITQTTTMDGQTVPMIVRWERGVINRFMYSIMLLSPARRPRRPTSRPGTARRCFSFSGGVAIGHYQGSRSGGDMRYLAGPRDGLRGPRTRPATRTNTHYNLQLGGETAIMVKDRFVSAYARAASTRSPSAAPAARSSSTSTGRTIRA